MSDQQAVATGANGKSAAGRNRLRWVVRLISLIACCGVLVVGSATIWPVLVPALSPLVTLSSLLVMRTLYWHSWLGIVVLVIVAWRHRWFCRWVCPMGFCADNATWLGRRWGRRRSHWPAIGQWIALLTLVGACIGYPLLLWLDPLALLSASVVSVTTHPSTLTAYWYLSGLAFVLLVSLLWPNLWCAKICPLGGTQDAVHGASNLVRSALKSRQEREPVAHGTRRGLRRRTMLGAIFGVVWATTTLRLRRNTLGPLRPPGAVDEPRFTGLCIRCGNCSRACPTNIIQHEMGEYGVAGLLTPKIEFHDDYCLETCNQCTVVCPSGAIGSVALEAKVAATIGVPAVNMDLCLLSDDRECSICRNRCPFEAIRLEFSEELYTLTPRVDLERCPGCGACQVACPTQPEKAIVVRCEM